MIEFRPLASTEIDEAVALWEACGLTSPGDDLVADARRAIDVLHSTLIGAFAGAHLIAAAMAGWDGGCGQIHYLAVEADFRRWGIGRQLVRACEEWLARFNAAKVQVMVGNGNDQAVKFCEAIGYEDDTCHIFSRQLRSLA